MNNKITRRHKQLIKDFEERGSVVIDELRDEDPEIYGLVLAEAIGQMEDLGAWNEEDPPEVADESTSLSIKKRDSESNEQALARYWMKPEFLAASSISLLTKIGRPKANLDNLIDELDSLSRRAKDGDTTRVEATLNAQAHTLDALFNSLIQRWLAIVGAGDSHTGREYLKLAMRAQSQCRSTIESLIAAKRPVIRQTNIAHGHQQVNNNPPNKLLEDEDGQRMDEGTPREAVKSDQTLETMGEEYGAEDD